MDGLLPAAELALPGELLLLADGSGAGLIGVELLLPEAELELELSAGAVDEVDGEAGAGVLIGAASLDELEVVAGGVDGAVAAESSVFLQPARAASTTAVASTVLRINMFPPV